MKPMPRYKKSNLLPQRKREELIRDAAEKANLIMTICVLHDCFGWGKKRINDFVDKYKGLADSFQAGDEDLDHINEEFWKRFDLKIM